MAQGAAIHAGHPGGYLALYAATWIWVEIAAQVLGPRVLRAVGLENLALTVLVALALAGVALRLYLNHHRRPRPSPDRAPIL